MSASSHSPLMSQSSLVLYRIKNLPWILGQKSENVCACTCVCIYIYIFYICVCERVNMYVCVYIHTRVGVCKYMRVRVCGWHSCLHACCWWLTHPLRYHTFMDTILTATTVVTILLKRNKSQYKLLKMTSF